LKPGILWNAFKENRHDDSCDGDACYVMRIQNWPKGIFSKLRMKLNYRHTWIFKLAYFMGHRFQSFGAYAEIRGGKVSRY
jgi:hypothetical protein